ncbi:MAG: dihydropteroate synthase [Candidatus Desulfatibia sp.]|uniref:dihydropteroate synthase n=1 Tax=Candidatus Desulfatibia sp. TaxID=3101189 RepID=UPI002F3375D4
MGIYNLSWSGHSLVFGKQTRIMGILNITPDSFSDGGKFFAFDQAVAQGQKLYQDGADILDVGGESTRPFSDQVSAEEEIRRVVPVIEKLASRVSIPISIDTTKTEVARRALEAGASMINDVSALRLDEDLAALAAEYDVPVILMHMLGTPKTMQIEPAYDDLISEIKTFLEKAIDRAVKKGIAKSKIIIDPGIGFGKTSAHNLSLIGHLSQFKTLDVPIMIGPSRKAFLRNILKDKNLEDIQPDLPVVETGTQAVVAASALNGAHIIRVHNVAHTRATLKIIDAIKQD